MAYGNEAGVGRALRASGLAREEVFVTTKLGDNRHGDARGAVQESLDRLGLDCLDLDLIHWPRPSVDKFVQARQELEQLPSDPEA